MTPIWTATAAAVRAALLLWGALPVSAVLYVALACLGLGLLLLAGVWLACDAWRWFCSRLGLTRPWGV